MALLSIKYYVIAWENKKYGVKINAKTTETIVCSKNREEKVDIRDTNWNRWNVLVLRVTDQQ